MCDVVKTLRNAPLKINLYFFACFFDVRHTSETQIDIADQFNLVGMSSSNPTDSSFLLLT